MEPAQDRSHLLQRMRPLRLAGVVALALGLGSAAGCGALPSRSSRGSRLSDLVRPGDRVGVARPIASAPRVKPHPEVEQQKSLAVAALLTRIVKSLESKGCQVVLVRGSRLRIPSSPQDVRLLASELTVDYLLVSRTELVIHSGRRAKEKCAVDVYSGKTGKRVRRFSWTRGPTRPKRRPSH